MEISKPTIPEMDVNLLGKELDETIDFQGQSGVQSTEGLTFIGEGAAGINIDNNFTDVDTMQFHTSQAVDQELFSPPQTVENDIQGSFPSNSSHPSELGHEDKGVLSPSKADHCKGEMDELDGHFSKPSFESLAKTSCSGADAQVSARAQESVSSVDCCHAGETPIDPKLDSAIVTPSAEDVAEIFQKEKPNQQDSEPLDANLTIDSGRTGVSDSVAPRTLLSSEVPESTAVNNTCKTNEDVQEKLCLSSSSGAKSKDSLPKKSSAHKYRQPVSPGSSGKDKEVGSRHHMSSSSTRTLASPSRPRHKDSSSMKRRSASPNIHKSTDKKRRSASPNVRKSPDKKRRQEHSRSRSPIRQRDSSSGQRRDHRGRSRSRSPHVRDQLRSSRTRHYSPGRRSPPDSGHHHSSRHSLLPRSWAPPPNRRTGYGKPGNNLFIAGFSFLTTERDLERKFSRFGRVRDVRIVRDRRSGDSRGFGFLSLERDEEADAAIRALDETEWNGRIILVEKSKSH